MEGSAEISSIRSTSRWQRKDESQQTECSFTNREIFSTKASRSAVLSCQLRNASAPMLLYSSWILSMSHTPSGRSASSTLCLAGVTPGYFEKKASKSSPGAAFLPAFPAFSLPILVLPPRFLTQLFRSLRAHPTYFK